MSSAAARVIAFALLVWPTGQTSAMASEVQFFCSFETSPTDCGFVEQAKVYGRATLVNIARHGKKGVLLHTEPGDSHVNGSRMRERNDLALSQTATDCHEGREQWWAHSILFPNDFVVPQSGVVANFHHSGSTGQANFQIRVKATTVLSFEGAGGLTVATNSRSPGRYHASIGPLVRNRWYDFVYHVKWSSESDGFMYAWVNGVPKLAHRGPTLYAGQGCYFKLANYHTASGPSSIIHDRVIRGTSARAVSLTPLQGMLH
ncbi:MAG TPA: heparin lyase I family protein [Burkholderiales bacterium]|nr:heparin lyase I family protein [Burkholderiales bacterium]